MKIDLQLNDIDQLLTDEQIVRKAEGVLRKALDHIQPGLSQHAHSHQEGEYEGKGGEVRAIGDATDVVALAYQKRTDKMLLGLAHLLVEDARGQR